MAVYRHGEFSRLSPAVEIDGISYSGMAKFNGVPAGSLERPVIVSGTIADVENLGGGWWKIVCARGTFTSSRLIAFGGGNSVEESWQWKGGTNICRCAEDVRPVNYQEPASVAGDNSHVRAQPGDGLRLVKSGTVYPVCHVRSALALEVEPDAVSWWPDEDAPQVDYAIADLYEVEWDATVSGVLCSLYFEPEASGLFSGSSVFCGSTQLERQVFELSGEPVEGYLPPDAVLDGASYWIDPVTRDLRISATAAAISGDLSVYYWVRDIRGPVPVESAAVMVLTAGGSALGYGGPDSVVLSGQDVLENFDLSFVIYQGAGSVEWRDTGAGNAALAALVWDDDGGGLELLRRHSGGSLAVVDSQAGPGIGAGMTVRIYKSGGTFYFTVNGTLVNSVPVTGVTTETGGIVSVGTTGSVKFLGPAGERRIVDLAGAGGLQHILRVASGSKLTGYQVDLRSDRTLDEMYNETAGIVMTETLAGAGRARYERNGDEVTFFPEANGDRIRMTYELLAVPHTGTGRPPRVMSYVANLATAVGDGGSSTTDPAENRANWFDALEVLWELPTDFPGVAGDAFEVVRWGVWDPAYPPAISYDLRNGGGDWTALDPADYLLLAREGVVLLTDDFLSGLAPDAGLCLRAEARVLRNGGRLAREIWNQLRDVLRYLEGAWISIATSGTGAIIGARALLTTSQYDGTPETAFGWGQEASPYALPFFYAPFGVPTYVDSTSGIDYETDPLDETFIPDNIEFNLYPEGPDDTEYSVFFGAVPGTVQLYQDWEARANFVAVPFRLAGAGLRIPDAATILEARLNVRFTGLKERTYRREYSNQPGASFVQLEQNGFLYYAEVDGETTVNDGPIPPDSSGAGRVSFRLVGRRRKTRNVAVRGGGEYALRDYDYTTYGSGITGSAVTSDEWVSVDVTDAVRALLGARDSRDTEFFWWPTVAGSPAAGDVSGLEGYILSLYGDHSADYGPGGGSPLVWTAASLEGRYCYADGLEFGELLVRLRFPDAEVDRLVLPLGQPVFSPE